MFKPIFSSRAGIVTFPSVDATMMFFPDEEGPNSFDKSILMVSMFPSTENSTFFIYETSLSIKNIQSFHHQTQLPCYYGTELPGDLSFGMTISERSAIFLEYNSLI